MLIGDYEIELSTPECLPGSVIYVARVMLKDDISEVLPYVNATVDKGEFIPGIPVLTWREGGRKYALRSREIAVSNLTDREQAAEVVRAIVERINETWTNRDGIEPSFESWEKPKVLEILKVLPRTNCRGCGLQTCMAYAARLAEGKICLEDCPALSDEDNSECLATLRQMGL